MTGRDRLDFISLLARIAHTGNLSIAAREVGISQPSASRLLKQLEELVQAKLVERSTHEVRLTAAGMRFLDATRTLVPTWQRAVEELQADREDLAGHLRIVMPVIAGQELMVPIAARFIRHNPGVTIECVLQNEEPKSTRNVDLWIRVGDLPTDDLVVRELWHIECALIASANHPSPDHPDKLVVDGAVRITSCVPETVELVHRDGRQFLLRQRAGFLVDNVFAARAAIREGAGFGVLPLWAVQADLQSGGLRRLCPDWSPPAVTLALAYPPSRHRLKRLEALLAFIRAELRRADGLGIAFIDAANARNVIHVISDHDTGRSA